MANYLFLYFQKFWETNVTQKEAAKIDFIAKTIEVKAERHIGDETPLVRKKTWRNKTNKATHSVNL